MSQSKKNIKICYVLSYKSPNYIRTATLVDALKLLPEVELFEARNTSKGVVRYIQTFFKFLKIRFDENPDIYILGFRSHEIYWLLRIFALNKVFIFDEMMSPYDSFVYERKNSREGSVLSKIFFLLEKSILRNTNHILTDTNLHANHFTKLFNIERERISVIPIGTDERNFDLENTDRKDFNSEFTVFFYGTFLPLHGVDVILDAANLLKELPIKFVLAGGQGREKDLNQFKEKLNSLNLSNVSHYQWLEYEELPKYIKGADICIGGPLGNTNQAQRVVTGKTYQFLAMGKATVIGKIEEDFGFIDRGNCLLVNQGDPKELAESIWWGYRNRGKLDNIGKKGMELYMKNFSSDKLARKIKEVLSLVLS